MFRAVLGWAAVTTSLVLLTACTSAETNHPSTSTTGAAKATEASAGPATAVDAAFVTTLIQLGSQNESMAGLVSARAGHTQLKALVPTVQQHAGDIQTMRAWMARWHALPTSSSSPSGVTATMLNAMAGMHGAMFDDDWLEHMGDNYAAAIAACRYELAHGTNAEARQLASDWMSWMQGQFERMRQWHTAWMHDNRFPSMMATATTPSSRPGMNVSPSPRADMPYSGTVHMSGMPRSATPIGTIRPATMPHMSSQSGMPHMTSPHR